MPDRSDEQLVRDFRRGDESAFSVFVARHQDRVYRVSLMWLYDPQHAEDAVQEAFLRTYTGVSRFRFRASPTTWLLKICRNVCREFNRRRTFEPLDDGVMSLLVEHSDAAGDLADAARVEQLRQVIGDLPERQRQVVTLRLLEDLSVAETAGIMRCREGTVKAHLNKALNALRTKLDLRGWE